MATKYFLGNGSAADYSAAAQWSGGTVPGATGDNVIIDNSTVGGSTRTIPGFDDSGSDLTAFDVTDGWNGNIGDVTTPLTIAVSNGGSPVASYNGQGTTYLATASPGIDRLDVNRTGAGTFFLTGGTTVDLYVSGGNVVIGASAVVTNLFILGGSVRAEQHASTGFTSVIQTGGTFISARDCATHSQHGGRYTAQLTPTVTTMNIEGANANVSYLSDQTITTLNLRSGAFSTAGSPFSGQLVTVTTLNRFRQGTTITDPVDILSVGTENNFGRPTNTFLDGPG